MCQWSLLFLLYCNRLWLILPLGVFNLWKLHRKQTFTILTAYIIGPWRDILVPRASIPNADQKDRSSGNEMVTREISTCWACALVAWCIAALGFCPPLGQFIRVQRKWLQSFAPSNPPPPAAACGGWRRIPSLFGMPGSRGFLWWAVMKWEHYTAKSKMLYLLHVLFSRNDSMALPLYWNWMKINFS